MWVTNNGKTWYSQQEFDELKAENEKLKAENEKLNEKYLASLRDNAINTELKLINDNLKAELEQYKKSKQASYETMQKEWNNAINENRLLRAALKNKNFVAIAEENEKLKLMLSEKYGVYR